MDLLHYPTFSAARGVVQQWMDWGLARDANIDSASFDITTLFARRRKCLRWTPSTTRSAHASAML